MARAMTKTIKEVLEELAESYYPEHEYGDSDSETNKTLINQALSEIEKIMDGVIGEIDTPWSGVSVPAVSEQYAKSARNQLRTTQRQSLKEVLGE